MLQKNQMDWVVWVDWGLFRYIFQRMCSIDVISNAFFIKIGMLHHCIRYYPGKNFVWKKHIFRVQCSDFIDLIGIFSDFYKNQKKHQLGQWNHCIRHDIYDFSHENFCLDNNGCSDAAYRFSWQTHRNWLQYNTFFEKVARILEKCKKACFLLQHPSCNVPLFSKVQLNRVNKQLEYSVQYVTTLTLWSTPQLYENWWLWHEIWWEASLYAWHHKQTFSDFFKCWKCFIILRKIQRFHKIFRKFHNFFE